MTCGTLKQALLIILIILVLILAISLIPFTSAVSGNMIFIQAIGFIAFGFGIWAFLQKDDKRLKIIQAIQSLILATHFFLLGSQGAVVACVITAIRNITALTSVAKTLAPLFILACIGLGLYRYNVWTDILPTLAVLVSTIGIFYLEKVPMRLCLLFATSMWIIHNAAVGSIGPFFMELFMFTANINTIRRMRRDS